MGHTLALLLAQARMRVALVAPPKPVNAEADVRAYALNAASRELLRKVRAWPEVDEPDAGSGPPVVTPVHGMAVFGDDGGEVHFDAQRTGQEALTWIVDVPALEQRLAQAVQFQGGIERVTEAPGAALTVICEGRRSATRDELGLEFEVRPYPHKAVAARLRCAQPHGGVARQWFKAGEIMALLPLDGAAGHTVALVWSVETAKADRLVTESPETLAQLIQEPLRRRAGRHADAKHCPRLAAGTLARPALDHPHRARWRGPGGRCRPRHAPSGRPRAQRGPGRCGRTGQGARANANSGATPATSNCLRRYERARQAEVSAMGWATDGLFGLFAQTDGRVQVLRNWGMSGVDRLDPLKNWLARQAMGTIA